MKTILKSFSFAIMFFIGLTILLNLSNTIAIESSFISLRVNVGFLILFCSALSIVASMLFSMSSSLGQKINNIQIKKQIETAKLTSEIESEKVKQLEAKIKTLEKALEMK